MQASSFRHHCVAKGGLCVHLTNSFVAIERDNFNVCRVAKILLTLFLDKRGRLFVGAHPLSRRNVKREEEEATIFWPGCCQEAISRIGLRASRFESAIRRGQFSRELVRARRKPAGIMLCLGPISQTPSPRVHIRSTLPFIPIILICVCATGE